MRVWTGAEQPARRLIGVDAIVAAAVCAVALLGADDAAARQQPPRDLDPAGYLLIVLASGPLVLRRVRPVPALAVTATAVAAFLAAGYPFGPVLFPLVVTTYTVASRLPMARSLPACGGALAAVELATLTRFAQEPSAKGATGLVGFSAWLVVPWSVGTVVRLRRDADARARREDAQRAATDERLRIARDVHDIAGHGLSVIAMQAGVALHVLDRRPEQARVALEEIRAASRDSLDGLRATLDVVTGREPAADRTTDPPAGPVGLDALDALVTRMRQAGLDVDLVVSGDRRPLAAETDLAAYRIVQESLTNVLRHAETGRARVTVEYTPDTVAVQVVDDGAAAPVGPPPAGPPPGPGPAGPPPVGNGRGIAGMRERAAAAGGSLQAGLRPDGGFRVHACLPLGGAG